MTHDKAAYPPHSSVLPDFKPFPKMPRFRRKVIITEKIDGTNSCIWVPEDPGVALVAGSRNRWIYPEPPAADNHGFARWVQEHSDELRQLGPGVHFGEWWGAGIGRRYPSVKEKRFSLFNVQRWLFTAPENARWSMVSDQGSPLAETLPGVQPPPPCCSVVPVIAVATEGIMNSFVLPAILDHLEITGSIAAPGHNAEGIVIYHCAANQCFKITLEDDDEPKSIAKKGAGR